MEMSIWMHESEITILAPQKSNFFIFVAIGKT